MDSIADLTEATKTPSDDHSSKVERMVEARADMVNVDALSDHVQVKILNIPLTSNFEQQLWDINATIMGDISILNTEPCKEVILGREEISLNQNDAKLGRKEGTHASGLTIEAQPQISLLGPQGPFMMLEHQPSVVLGLTQSSINFRMGLLLQNSQIPRK